MINAPVGQLLDDRRQRVAHLAHRLLDLFRVLLCLRRAPLRCCRCRATTVAAAVSFDRRLGALSVPVSGPEESERRPRAV